MSKKIAIPFAFSVVLVGSFFIFQHNKVPSESNDKNPDFQQKPAETASEKKENGFKKKASLPIKLEEVVINQSSASENSQEYVISKEVPAQCSSTAVLNELLESSGDGLVEKARDSSNEVKSCLASLGSPKDCFSSEPGADEDKSCLNNLLIARASLIDKLSEGKSLKSLDVAVIANKIVAKIYESPDSVEKKGPEIFALADEILNHDPENQEAHNLRAISGIAALKQNYDMKTLAKAKESASLLENFSDPSFARRGILSRFAYSLIGFIVTKDSSNLENANSLAEEFLAKFSNRPEGYHMKATVEGLRNNLDLCKHFTRKGLDVGGPGQSGYQEYVELIKSIEAGSIKRELLGVRYDRSETFRPDELLK